MEKKVRVNWLIKEKTKAIIQEKIEQINNEKKRSGNPNNPLSEGKYIDLVIEQKVVNPLETLRIELKQKQQEIQQISDRIYILEQDQHYTQPIQLPTKISNIQKDNTFNIRKRSIHEASED